MRERKRERKRERREDGRKEDWLERKERPNYVVIIVFKGISKLLKSERYVVAL